jgi:hypothetical protein
MPYDVATMRSRLQSHLPAKYPSSRYRPYEGQYGAPTTIGSSGPGPRGGGGSPGPRPVQCPHAETRIVKLQNHYYWAREECTKCGKFIRWPKQPVPDVPKLIAAIKATRRPVAIQGSPKQITWATRIRHTLITRFQHRGATALLESVHSSGWLIANRDVQQYQDLGWPAIRDIG